MQNVMTQNLEQPGGWENLVNEHARVAAQEREQAQLDEALRLESVARESYNVLMRQKQRNAKKQSDRYMRKLERIVMGIYLIVSILALVILLEVYNVISVHISVPVALAGLVYMSFLLGRYFQLMFSFPVRSE